MSEGNKSNLFVNKLDQVLEEYSKRIKLEHQVDIYSDGRIEPEGAVLDCKFKDNCYALKFNQGSCPCELNE